MYCQISVDMISIGVTIEDVLYEPKVMLKAY